MCVNEYGVAIPGFKSDQLDFEGKCQKVGMCQLQSEYVTSVKHDIGPLIVADEEARIAD